MTPNIRYIALKFYVIDKINHRKIHKKIVTKLGGFAIYFGFLVSLVTIVLFDLNFFRINFYPLIALVISTTFMLMLGIYDDFHGSGALQKLIIQSVVAVLAIKSGFILQVITIPGIIEFKLGLLSIPITLIWLIGITNAINLIDGLDGLAAGLCGISFCFITCYGLLLKDSFVLYVSLALAGACFAFLKYNFYPAKIFMGDTGSLFLGLTLGCLAIYKPSNTSVSNPYFIPVVLVLFLPIFDTFFALIRRMLHKQHIFRGDSAHIHHSYVKMGFTQAQTTIRFYIMTFFLGVSSLFVLFASLK